MEKLIGTWRAEVAGSKELEKVAREALGERFGGFAQEIECEITPDEWRMHGTVLEWSHMGSRGDTFDIALGGDFVTITFVKPDTFTLQTKSRTLTFTRYRPSPGDELASKLESLDEEQLDEFCDGLNERAKADVGRALTIIRQANGSPVDLRHGRLRGIELPGAQLTHSILRESDLFEADLRKADLSRADLSGCHAGQTNFQSANLQQANLSKSFLFAANLRQADLSGADLREAQLSDILCGTADLTGANLYRAKMHKAMLKKVAFSGANLEGARLQQADLQMADLSGVNLSMADLRGSRLQRANLQNANLCDARLENADLRGVDLRGARLESARLSGALVESKDWVTVWREHGLSLDGWTVLPMHIKGKQVWRLARVN